MRLLPALPSSFPLTRKSLSKYQLSSNLRYTDIAAARTLVHAIQSSPVKEGSQALYPSELVAIGVMGTIYRQVLLLFDQRVSPSPFQSLDRHLTQAFGEAQLTQLLSSLIEHYPSLHVNDATGEKFRISLYKTSILIILANENPAIQPYQELFLDNDVLSDGLFLRYREEIEQFFLAHAPSSSFMPRSDSLLSLLRSPFQTHPRSIFEQLLYIMHHWKGFLNKDLESLLSKSLDYIREEHRERGIGFDTIPDPLPLSEFMSYSDDDSDHFSLDSEWMSHVVLIAKHIYVWFDQLSRKYARHIATLDEIPDEELALLAQRGITGLWLIGVWERSPASRRIKQLCGNPEAIPSAYSIYDYSISQHLGGEEALHVLSQKASRFGVRLAADMVPNHMGIYSKKVIEHPGFFLYLEDKPYPNYSYTGPDLSDDEDISIFLEDHYYDNTDAAVVFKRIDHQSQDVRYIYHGNDGTAMPWNDTAQLNYLIKEVREDVIQTILSVADRFPIIRFDAAMTLAKRHYQRLWFPEPGSGGAIPTRSEHSMTKDAFNALFPQEFWRLVVDRIADEHPDTLLIAEAFWMMEGFFVRNLGMHRVYNSAFMHMLRDEKNAHFREVIVKTLSYDPRILRRYVNFMNNPDEETAIAQFGQDGKYFGVCVLMATLPGLPMFGHGQIEGLHEKYGMEYNKAYYEERPNQTLISRHEKEIFPLLKKRSLFSGVDHFVFYNFISDFGRINEDVFVYSNRKNLESALVIYHNKWNECKGVIHKSVELNGIQQALGPSLGLENLPQSFILFKDHISGLEYIRPTEELFSKGLEFELGAYEYRVFLEFRQVSDTEHDDYAALCKKLSGSGVENIETELNIIRFREPALFLERFITFVQNKIPLHAIATSPSIEESVGFQNLLEYERSSLSKIIDVFHNRLWEQLASEADYEDLSHDIKDQITTSLRSLAQAIKNHPNLTSYPMVYSTLLSWLLLAPSLAFIPDPEINRSLYPLIYNTSREICATDSERENLSLSLSVAIIHTRTSLLDVLSPSTTLDFWLKNDAIRQILHLHEYEGVQYYHQEGFESVLLMLEIIERLRIITDTSLSPEDRNLYLKQLKSHHSILQKAHEHAHYQVHHLLEKVSEFESNPEL